MNNKTLLFHLQNIGNNNRFIAHKSAVEQEISDLRLTALKFKGTNIARISESKANNIQRLLDKAILKRIQL